MDKILLVARRGAEYFEIIDGGFGGVLIFRYVAGENTHDYYQSDVPMAQRCAEAEWGIELSAWQPAAPGETPVWQSRAEVSGGREQTLTPSEAPDLSGGRQPSERVEHM